MSRWLFNLTPLTPLHIGAGDTLQPYEYAVIDGSLYYFEPEKLIMKLDKAEQERFVSLVGINIGELQRFLHRQKQIVREVSLFGIPVTSQAQQVYQERLDNPRTELTVYPFIKTVHKPFIPGSSLKGAIRTALLYTKAYTKARKQIRLFDAGRLERETFRYDHITDDPFKTLKISDSKALPNSTQLAIMKVYTRRQGRWTESIPMLREVTLSKLSTSSQLSFSHTVELNEKITYLDPKLMKFNMEQIIDACRQFYSLHLDREAQYLANLPQAVTWYQKLQNFRAQLSTNSFLIRFGWGSGFDAVTVHYAMEKYQAKRSRRLSEDKIPLGWAQVEVRPC